MKTRLFITMAAATMILAGCSNDENGMDNGPVELRLTSGVTVQQTRANTQAEQIAANEVIYAWVDDAGSTTPSVVAAAAYINAWKLTAGGFGNFFGTSMYFPKSGNGVDIYAMHGNFGSTFTEGIVGTSTEGTAFPTTALTHTVASNQAPGESGSMANYTQSDLLYARKTGAARSNSSAVQLTFYHMLSKVEVALKAGTGSPDLTDATVTIENTKLKADFTLNKETDIAHETSGQSNRAGMIELTKTENDVASITIGNAVTTSDNWDNHPVYNEAIIVPQTINANGEAHFIKVQLKDKAALFYNVSNQAFESGKKYSYKITVNLTGLTVTSNIEDWTTVTPVNDGTATME